MSRDLARAATQFFGGRLCLDFANTIDWRTSNQPQELIPDYDSFLNWSSARGTVSARTAKRLRVLVTTEKSAGIGLMSEVYALRADILTAADALRTGGEIPLGRLNRFLDAAPPQPSLVELGAGYAHELPGTSLHEPVWPILWSVSALLTSNDVARIGCCQAQDCGWYFVDESPNRTRIWCSSEVCGNRERARRSYARRRPPRSKKN
jgi:predicted RNA-binding Zn ribbon-like protein